MPLSRTFPAILAVAVCCTASLAQDKKPDPKELQKQFDAFSTPGKQHEHFKRLVGRWNAAMTIHHAPGQTEESTGTATFRGILGGRYLQQRFQGEFTGMKFQGLGLMGYDNAKKKYVGSWVDTAGTGILNTEGTYDPKTQTMTETGTASSPAGPMKMKTVSKYLSNDKFTFTMFIVTDAGEQKMMELTYTRAPGGKKQKKQGKAKPNRKE